MKRAFLLSALAAGCMLTGMYALIPRENTVRPAREPHVVSQYSSFSDDSTVFLSAFKHHGTVLHGSSPPDRQGAHGAQIRAGIVSHHLLVKGLIADYFVALSQSARPSLVILLGPNHRARGPAPIAVSDLPWKTPFGMLEADTGMVRMLLGSGLASRNEDAFFHEHSIGALVPFIKRLFPSARIVPIIFCHNADSMMCERLGEWLAAHTGESTLLLGSMDFSHYKTSVAAERDDARSLPVIRELRLNEINSVVVDSRPALRTLLMACRLEGATQVKVVQHTNSGILMREPKKACTSYMNLLFSRL